MFLLFASPFFLHFRICACLLTVKFERELILLLFSLYFQIEDEGNHGNDETRLFILSSLAAQHKSRVACVLCEEPMLVFDRYPLVDGTFFLSPRKHANGCIEVGLPIPNISMNIQTTDTDIHHLHVSACSYVKSNIYHNNSLYCFLCCVVYMFYGQLNFESDSWGYFIFTRLTLQLNESWAYIWEEVPRL